MSSTLDYIINKYNLPKEGSPIEIPNVGRLDLIRWFRELGFKTGVEIGVDHGDFSKLIIDSNYQLKMYGVDPYLHYWDEYHEYDSQEQMDHIYNRATEKLGNEVKSGRYTFVRKKSMDALADFEDESLDFVYIDGNHEGEFPYLDIKHWMKKVRKGGIVAGHDYVRIKTIDFTIKDALERYTKEENIKTWFVLGRYMVKPREIRDHSRSWVLVKE
jgi:hypothetical protein